MKHYEDNPMLTRGQRKLQSQGQDIRVLFKIEVQKVIVTNDSAEKDYVTGISVCFERGYKLAISSEHKTKLMKGQTASIDFNESLSIVTTLHKDNSGSYMEKFGKLTVRRASASTLGGTGFTRLGMTSLPLHRLISDFQSQQFNIPLTNNDDAVGRIDVVITPTFIAEVTADETSEGEDDSIIPVETADFEDPSSSSGESKRNGAGAKGLETTTDKAYESAMSAAMATNKAATKKAETLSMDLDKLQYKLSKLTQEGAEQEEIIGMLQQQIVEGKSKGNPSSTFEVRALQEEIERGREKAELQEVKLKQAAEFISYQEEQIGTLTGEVQNLTEQVQGGSRRAGMKGSDKDKEMEKEVHQLREELEDQKARAEAYLLQLRDGAKYVQTIQEQLDEATGEVERLSKGGKERGGKASPAGRDELAALRDEIAAKDEKIEQASEYVTYQKTQISDLTSEVQELTEQLEAASKNKSPNGKSGHKGEADDLRAQLAECETRLEKGAEYVDNLQAQMDELTVELENMKKAEEIRRSLDEDEDNHAKGKAKNSKNEKNGSEMRELLESKHVLESELEQSKTYCKSYLTQLSQGGELVKELQKEVKVKTELIQALNAEMQAMDVTVTSLKAQLKAKTGEVRSPPKPTPAHENTISRLERDLKVTTEELEDIRSELLEAQNEAEESKKKLERLERSAGQKSGTRGRSGGGYDANIDRISDLEDELELLKIRLESSTSEAEKAVEGKKQEAQYYKEQSEEYLKKLQEGAEYVNNLQSQMKELEEELERLKATKSHSRPDPFATGSAVEEELKECKLIIHKYGGKLEQASAFIDDLENQLAEARGQLDSGSVDGSVYGAQEYSAPGARRGDSSNQANNDRKCKELEAKVRALEGELSSNAEHSADQVMSDLISYKMQYALAAADVEEEKKKNKDGQAKLQTFARRISALEHALADANEQTALANEPKGMFSYFRGSTSGSTAGSTAGSDYGGNSPIRYGPGPGPGVRPQGGRGPAGGGRGPPRPGGPTLQAVRR